MCYLYYPNGELCYSAETESELENYMVDDFLRNVRFIDWDGYDLEYAVNINISTKGQSISVGSFYKKNVECVIFLDEYGNVCEEVPVEPGLSITQILKKSYIYGWTAYNEKKQKKITIKITTPNARDYY